MLVAELLLETLEDMNDPDFRKFQWYLSLEILDGYDPVPKSVLEDVNRTKTVNVMIQRYCKDPAVKIALEILQKMNMNAAAQKLKSAHAGGQAAATSTPACVPEPAPAPAVAPVTMSAQNGGLIFAPTVTGSKTGAFNITINKT